MLCAPSIAESRNKEAIENIVSEIRAFRDVRILDYSSDEAHHRTVLTYLGKPELVLEATKAMTKRAFELIDMRARLGAHPQLCAVDVVPFVPVRGVKTSEAVEIARRYGR